MVTEEAKLDDEVGPQRGMAGRMERDGEEAEAEGVAVTSAGEGDEEEGEEEEEYGPVT